MDNRNCHPAEKSKRHEALLAVAESIVLERERSAFEDSRGIAKIKPVNLEVLAPLALVPTELYIHSVYTDLVMVKAGQHSAQR